MMEDRFSVLLFRTCLVGCLLGVVATIYFFLGLTGYVGNSLPNLFVAASLVAATIFFLKAFIGNFLETNWVGRLIWLSILFVLGAEIILCLVPPTARDELTHHLAMPRLYARAGRIIEVPMAPYSYYPMLLDMLYTPWVSWGYDSVPKLIHGFYGVLTGLALHAYLSRRMNAIYGLLGFFFFVSTPAVLRLNHWAYVDLGITFYSTASLLCLLRWREEKNAIRWLVITALSAGFAVATKPNGLVVLLILSFLFVLTLANESTRGTNIVSEVALFGTFALLPFLPWLIKNTLQTGSPFFPHLASLFPPRGGAGSETMPSYVEIGIIARRQFLYGESWWEIAALPLRIFFQGQDDNPRYFDGVLSPVLILFLPWAFKGKWLAEKKICMSFALLFLAYAMFLVDLRIRYILVIVPPLVVLLVYGIFNVYLRIKQPAYLFAGVLLFAAVNLSYLWQYSRDVAPVRYLLSNDSKNTYLREKLAEYPAFQYINGELPGFLLAAIRSAKEPTDIGRQLESKHLTHLLVRDELLSRFLRDNLDPAHQRVWDSFALSHLKTLFRDRGY